MTGVGSPFWELKHFFGAFPCEASGEISASELVYDGPCLLVGIVVNTDGVNDALGVVYDNSAASGKVVGRWRVKADENHGGCMHGLSPVKMENGIYVALSGTGASFQVYYRTE
jgi:hypothetical protein